MTNLPSLAPRARQRVALKSEALAGMLRHCSRVELEILIRYYVEGQDEQRVIEETGCTPEEFRRLLVRMREGAAAGCGPRCRAAAAR